MLAQNQKGLNNLFKLISLSHQGDNFYRFPRIDLEMLKKYNEGLIVSTACLGGLFGGTFFEYYDQGIDIVRSEMKKIAKQFIDIFGDRFYR